MSDQLKTVVVKISVFCRSVLIHTSNESPVGLAGNQLAPLWERVELLYQLQLGTEGLFKAHWLRGLEEVLLLLSVFCQWMEDFSLSYTFISSMICRGVWCMDYSSIQGYGTSVDYLSVCSVLCFRICYLILFFK